MAGFTIPGLLGATAMALLINSAPAATWTPDAPPPDPPGEITWDGDPEDQLLTVVDNTRMMSEAARFAPFAIQGDVFVTGGPFTRSATWTDYDPTYHQYTYVLVTGDATLGRNSRVGDPSHRQRSFRLGQQARHVYGVPGEYTYQWYVYAPDGKWGKSAPVTITVADPADKISAAQTVVLSNVPAETWADAPPHDSANRCTTMQAALNRYNTLKANGPVRVSARPGTSYSELSLVPPGNAFRFNTGRVHFDTWGPGDRVVLDPACTFDGGTPNAPVSFSSWRLVYAWDRMKDMRKPSRPAPISIGGPFNTGWTSTAVEANPHFILHNTDVVNQRGTAAYFPTPLDTSGIFFNDCHFEDFGDYLTLECAHVTFHNSWVSVSYGVALGLMDRRRMGGEFADFGHGHNSFRHPRRTLSIDGSYMEARGGWSGQNGNGTLWDMQALVRTQGTDSFPGQRNYLSRSIFVGDLQLGSDGSQTIIEHNVIAVDPAVRNNPSCGPVCGGFAIRGNVFVAVPGPKDTAFLAGKNVSKIENGMNPGSFTAFMALGNGAATANRPLQILNNTYIVHKNSAGYPGAWTPYQGSVASGVTIHDGHNITYAPDHGSVPAGGVEFIAQDAWEILDIWMRVGWERQTYVLPSSWGPGQQTGLIPYPNDFNGNPTTQASYAGGIGRDAAEVGTSGVIYFVSSQINGAASSFASGMTIQFEAGGFRLTNTSASGTVAAGETLVIMLDRGSTLEEPTLLWTIDQTKKRLVRPLTPQAETAGQPKVMFSFDMGLRPGAGFAISPVGTYQAGAVLASV